MEPLLGTIILFAGNFAPRGWALCNGQLLSIAQNTALFSILGTTYGGDGKTTFALPDLRGRVPVGTGQGQGLSNHQLGDRGGAETLGAQGYLRAEDGGFQAGNNTATNLPPFVTLNYIIALEGVYPSRP